LIQYYFRDEVDILEIQKSSLKRSLKLLYFKEQAKIRLYMKYKIEIQEGNSKNIFMG